MSRVNFAKLALSVIEFRPLPATAVNEASAGAEAGPTRVATGVAGGAAAIDATRAGATRVAAGTFATGVDAAEVEARGCDDAEPVGLASTSPYLNTRLIASAFSFSTSTRASPSLPSDSEDSKLASEHASGASSMSGRSLPSSSNSFCSLSMAFSSACVAQAMTPGSFEPAALATESKVA